MAKVLCPLFSISAHGSIGGKITYTTKFEGHTVVKKKIYWYKKRGYEPTKINKYRKWIGSRKKELDELEPLFEWEDLGEE